MFSIKNPYFYMFIRSKGHIKKFKANRKIYDSLKESEWFDEKYYLKKYPTIKKSGINPLLHYLIFGTKENKIPSHKFNKIYNLLKNSEWFDEKYYLKKYPTIKKSGINPLLHYLIFGTKENKIPSHKFNKIYNLLKNSEWFDEKYYLKKYPTIKKSGINPLQHYLILGNKENKIPSHKFNKIYNLLKNSEWFDEKYYLKKYPTIKKSGINPLLHYLIFGTKENKIPSHKFNKIYNLLKNSEWFDEKYYLKKYPTIKKSGINPLLHYLILGYKEGYNPSLNFDGNFYLNSYEDVKNSGYNPVVHYVLYGKDGRRMIKSGSEEHDFKYSFSEIDRILSTLNSGKIVILLYIHNDFENAEKCITSILDNTKVKYELILINDGSTDERVAKLLNQLGGVNGLSVRQNTAKMGFLESVKQEIKNSKDDILLIKSNIIVTPRWLQKMVVAAYSDEKIGTVIPLSNKFLSDIISKTFGVQQTEPNEINFLIETVSEHLKPEFMYPDESCIFIKRKVIDDVGLFDDDDIIKTYKSFHEKILDNGWKNIIEDSTYIYDNNEPFDDDKLAHFPNRISERIQLEARHELGPKKRLLYVLHEKVHGLTGGTGQTTKDILEKIDDKFESYILTSTGKVLMLWKHERNHVKMLRSWDIKSKWSALEFYSDEFKYIYFKVLVGLNIDIVHIQHLLRHTRDILNIIKLLGIPTILSFHDFYYICPSINLLNNDNQYCELKCTDQTMQCKYPLQIFDELPILKDFVDIWRKEGSVLIENCSAFTAPTKSAMDIYISIYPELKNKNYKLIEHGRDIGKTSPKFELPSKDKPIKILVPGIIKNHKGHDFIKQLKEIDNENRIEFHFMGIINDDLKELGIYHGKYERENFCKIVNEIKPSFIGIFSICPETYCHTLTEAWSCGIPVLVTKIGALEERVIKNGGGWFLDHNSPLKSYNKIIQISGSLEDYLKVAEGISDIKIRTIEEMNNEYELLYRKI